MRAFVGADLRVRPRSLLGCDALMLMYGQSPGGCVRQQLMNCRKLKRENPLCALAVLEGRPPANEGDLGISLPNLRKRVCHQPVYIWTPPGLQGEDR